MSDTITEVEVPELTPEQEAIVRQWVADLRSDKFDQTTGRLEQYTEDDSGELTGKKGFCCLGVVAQQEALYKDTDFHLDTEFDTTTIAYVLARKLGTRSSFRYVTSLPLELAARLTLNRIVPQPCCGDQDPLSLQNLLIHLNDAERWTFRQIAELIERVLLNNEQFEAAFAAAEATV